MLGLSVLAALSFLLKCPKEFREVRVDRFGQAKGQICDRNRPSGNASSNSGTIGKMGAEGHHLNDDKNPLIDLLNCMVCKETMKIEKSAPDSGGHDIIQYRCKQCDRIERVRLFRRNRDAAG
jgi:hypothetical protein